MKKLLFTLAFISFALVSCQKETGVQKSVDSKAFTASINSPAVPAGVQSKTTINSTSGQVSWSTGDVININGSNFYTTTSGSTATFTTDDSYFEENDSYEAFFPFNIAAKSLPSTYNYTKETSNYLPMYAYSTTKSLTFNNICSVIALTIPASMNVNKVVLSTTDSKAINGQFNIVSNKAVMKKTSGITASEKKITVTGNPLSDVIYIPVPAASYSSFTIEIFDVAGTSEVRTKSLNLPVSCIQPISFSVYASTFILSDTAITSIDSIL